MLATENETDRELAEGISPLTICGHCGQRAQACKCPADREAACIAFVRRRGARIGATDASINRACTSARNVARAGGSGHRAITVACQRLEPTDG